MQESSSGNEQYENLNEEMYKSYYRFSGQSETLERIWSNAFGNNYPTGLDHFGFVTNADIKMFTSLLKSKQGDVLLDIGCGKGGAGLKIAEYKQLKLVGIDIIREAIIQANLLQEKFDLSYKPQFEVGGFCNIPLPDNSVDSIISIDAFWMVQDKAEALREMKRVAKNGAQFLFTTWDSVLLNQTLLMESHGFQVISKTETEQWKTYQMKVYDSIQMHKEQLLKEMGEAADILISEAQTVPLLIDGTIRQFYHTKINK